MSKVFIGVDPGAKGAMAILEDDKVTLIDMLQADEILKGTYKHKDCIVALEDVHPLPGQSCTATFSYGQNFMLAKIWCMMYNIEGPVMVSPQRWKNFYGLKRQKDESKADFKRKSVELARELFPSVVDQLQYSKDGRAEALLIANYIRETHGGH